MLIPSLQWRYTITNACTFHFNFKPFWQKKAFKFTAGYSSSEINRAVTAYSYNESDPKSKTAQQGEEEKWHKLWWREPHMIIIKNYLQEKCPGWDYWLIQTWLEQSTNPTCPEDELSLVSVLSFQRSRQRMCSTPIIIGTSGLVVTSEQNWVQRKHLSQVSLDSRAGKEIKTLFPHTEAGGTRAVWAGPQLPTPPSSHPQN